eukprot:TRINITY_DN1376_c0_g6_i1.p1 TRINITY_DN1376_c0_g6~~TRINITY_DN1376_c0_g6_i1.p1  ORF type:complete len:1241 (-),score=463.36 TRINITY_DN1376_c0_g6_i1:317-4039(-)
MDPLLVFWKAFAVFKEGAVTEAIHELSKIQSKWDLQFATVLALSYYHRSCNIVDQEAVAELDGKLASSEKTASEKALVTSAQFLHYIGESAKARKVLKALINKTSEEGRNPEAHAMLAWIDLSRPKEVQHAEIEESLRASLDPKTGGNAKHISTLLAMAKTLEVEKKFKDSLSVLSDVTVVYKDLVPALLEKARLLIYLNEWDQVIDAVQKASANKFAKVACARIQIFQLLAREGDRQKAVDEMKDLIKAFDSYEPKNPEVYYSFSQLFARVSGGNDFVLQRCMEMIKRSVMLNPSNSLYLTEQAYQLTLMQEYAQAFQLYQKAAELDETNMSALYGMIYCRIRQNQLDDIEDQLQFVTELESTASKALYSFYKAMILFRRDNNLTESLGLLNETLQLHVAEAKTATVGFDFYIKLNPWFLMELAQEYLRHSPASKKFNSSDGLPTYLTKGIKLLEMVTKQTPGIIEARMLLAKAKWISGDVTAAQNALNACITMAPDNVEPYVLSAQIHMEEGNLAAATSSLENALAENFLVRDQPYFMYIKGQVEIAKKDYPKALETIEVAFQIPAVKNNVKDVKSKAILRFGEEERVNLYVMLITVYEFLKKTTEAKKTMQKAIGEFAGTPYETYIMLAQADMALKGGDVKKALNMLKKIPFDSSCFKEARIKMADIYLNQLLDRRHYAKCYMEIVKSKETPEYYRLAGDAMMRIQEPEKAIELYEHALGMSKDSSLVRDIGRALIMTHDYQRAIKYYETALLNDGREYILREDLSELHMKLGEFEAAKEVVYHGLERLEKEEKNLKTLKSQVGLQMTLLKVIRKEAGGGKYKKLEGLKEEYSKVVVMQLNVINYAKEHGGGDMLEKAKTYAAQISYELADYLENAENDYDGAKAAYVESLRHFEFYKPSLLALANLLSRRGEFDACQMACNRLLKVDPQNEKGTYLAADTLFLRGMPEQGLALYKTLLTQKPDSYEILCNFVLFAKRLGQINEAFEYIENASKLAGRSNEPGVLLARGIYERNQGNAMEALRYLNGARVDRAFARMALINMIEIYLNLDNVDWCLNPQPQQVYIDPENLKAASSLTEELNIHAPNDPIISVYRAYNAIFKRDAPSLEQGLKILTKLLKQRMNYVPGVVALAVLKFVQKKSSDGKKILKQIQNVPYVAEESAHIERGWLLLANSAFYSNDTEVTKQLCEKCVKYNKSNQNAEELIGLLREKANMTEDAIKHYEAAWKLANHNSATIG